MHGSVVLYANVNEYMRVHGRFVTGSGITVAHCSEGTGGLFRSWSSFPDVENQIHRQCVRLIYSRPISSAAFSKG
jgi:hypothetical protein